ncbi:MAG: protein phosphatase 2C domain-containing protein [Fimbriimonadaceae bacterium]|jgi:hypothetical protein|nr:protein phosphatase 2C domain-containing protein [Fimbriimonadaceae bacterium]
MGWVFASAISKGAIHQESEPCQDAASVVTFWSNGQEGLLAVVSDGAGSAKLSHLGSQRVVEVFVNSVLALVSGENSHESRCGLDSSDASLILHLVQQVIHNLASELKIDILDLSSTLVGLVILNEYAFVMQVGDGAVALFNGSEWVVPVWPQNGEFVNETTFVTSQDASHLMKVKILRGEFEGAIAFTDGLQYLVLDHQKQQVHQPFFQSVWEKVPKSEGWHQGLASWLDSILKSEPVTNKTDDDTTLVVARRWP